MLGKVALIVLFCDLCQAIPLKSRLNFLEHMFKQESLWTRTQLSELQELIGTFNDTDSDGGDNALGRSEDVEKGLDKIDEMSTRLHKQDHRMNIMMKGLAAEKEQMRRMINLMKDLVNSNTDSVLEIQMVMGKTKDQYISFQNQINELKRTMTRSVGKMDSDTRKLKTDFEARLEQQNVKLSDLVKKTVESFSPRKECPQDWAKVEDVCYVLFDEERETWETANTKCKELGAILFEADTRGKRQLIKTSEVWLGGYDVTFDGSWRWIGSGRDIKQMAWARNQPNNYNGKQWCLELYEGTFNDETCSIKNSYACQKALNSN